jgi:hypothetical protein
MTDFNICGYCFQYTLKIAHRAIGDAAFEIDPRAFAALEVAADEVAESFTDRPVEPADLADIFNDTLVIAHHAFEGLADCFEEFPSEQVAALIAAFFNENFDAPVLTDGPTLEDMPAAGRA